MADQVNILSQAIDDQKSKIAVRQLERLLQAAMDRLKAVEETLGASAAGGSTSAVTSVTGTGSIHAAPTTGAVVLTFTGVSSVTAGSAFVTVAPTSGNVVVDVNPSMFGAATGTVNRVAKFTAVHTLGDSSTTDDGTTVTVQANAVLGTLTATNLHTVNGCTSMYGTPDNTTLYISGDDGSLQTSGSSRTVDLNGNAEVPITGAHERYGLYASTNLSRANAELGGDITAYGIYTEATVGSVLGSGIKTAYSIYAGAGTAFFSTGLDTNSQKITHLANGTVGSDAVNLSQLTGAVAGTNNYVAKFTGANSVGNSSITDDGAKVLTALPVGIGSVSTPGAALDVGINADASVTNQVVQAWRNNFTGQNFSVGLTVDSAKNVHFSTSSGNTAWRFDNSSGTQIVRLDTKAGNTALTVTGDSYLNGGTGVGAAPVSNSQLYVISNRSFGVYSQTQGTGGAGNPQTLTGVNAETGRTGTPQVVYGSTQGTFDCTLAGRTGYTGYFENTATRSAGTNGLTNIALFAHATGGQGNLAIYTYSGDVWLNTNSGTTTAWQNMTVDKDFFVNGNTTLGNSSASDTTTVNGTLFTRRAPGAAGVVIGDGSAKDWTWYLSGTAMRLFEYNTTFGTGGNDRLSVGSTGLLVYNDLSCNGNATLGDTTSDVHTVHGKLTSDSFIRVTTTSGNDGFIVGTSSKQWDFYPSGSDLRLWEYNTTQEAGTGADRVLFLSGGTVQLSTAPTAGPLKVGATQARILLGIQVLTSTSGTYTPTTGTKAVRVRMVGGGGGGGGVSGSASNAAGAGGGGAGSYVETWISAGSDVTGGAYAAGAGGTGGAAGINGGNTGNDSTVVINGTTYTAKAGTGGGAMSAGSTVSIAVAGAGQAGSSTGTIANVIGMVGGSGIRLSGGVAQGGQGGSSPLGGGAATTYNVAGSNGTGYGAGGSGGSTGTSTSQAGGNGTAGVVIIEEYA